MADGTTQSTTTTVASSKVAEDGFQQGQQEAQPPEGQQKTDQQQPRMFTEEQVQKIRKDEKDKLYGELQQTQSELAEIRKAQAEKDKAEAELAKQQAADAKTAREAEMDAKKLIESRDAEWNSRFEKTNQEWENRFAQINQEREQERALVDKERKYNEFLGYRNDRLQAERENIAPELIDLVSGSTPEELEASITTLKAKSEQIAQTVQQFAQQARANQRGVSSASFPAVGPDTDNPGGKQITAEDIAGMNFEEYAKFRQQYGIGGSQSGKGLFS